MSVERIKIPNESLRTIASKTCLRGPRKVPARTQTLRGYLQSPLRRRLQRLSPRLSLRLRRLSLGSCVSSPRARQPPRTTRQTQNKVSATLISTAGRTKTPDRQQHACRAHRDTERGPQNHSLEDLLLRSEESPCEDTDAPWARLQSPLRRRPQRLSPRLSLRFQRLSLRSCASSPRASQPPTWRSHDVPGCASKSQTNAHDCSPKHDDARTTKSLSDDQRAKDRM